MVPSNQITVTIKSNSVVPNNLQNIVAKQAADQAPENASISPMNNLYTKSKTEAVEISQLRLPMVCHELRTPLLGIMGYTDTLASSRGDLESYLKSCDASNIDTKLKSEILKYLELQRVTLDTIDSCAKYQNVLINDVLDFSKLQAGKLNLNITAFDPKKLLDRVLSMLKIQAQAKKITVSVLCESLFGPDQVMGDEIRVQQVLLNLVNNAIKFTPQSGKIVITFSEPKIKNDEVTLIFSIEDTGVGMTPSQLSTLFTTPKQSEAEANSQARGAGLGLWISKALVNLMGGTIEVMSPLGTENKGSKFTFTIQCKKIQNINSPVLIFSQPKKANTNGKHILVVDDHVVNRKIAQRTLENAGYRCTVAKDGKEAVQLYVQNQVDVILMDVEMPVMNGIEATKQIRLLEKAQQKKSIPIFALTATPMNEAAIDELRTYGMNESLCKPFKEEQLFEILSKYEAKQIVLDTQHVTINGQPQSVTNLRAQAK